MLNVGASQNPTKPPSIHPLREPLASASKDPNMMRSTTKSITKTHEIPMVDNDLPILKDIQMEEEDLDSLFLLAGGNCNHLLLDEDMFNTVNMDNNDNDDELIFEKEDKYFPSEDLSLSLCLPNEESNLNSSSTGGSFYEIDSAIELEAFTVNKDDGDDSDTDDDYTQKEQLLFRPVSPQSTTTNTTTTAASLSPSSSPVQSLEKLTECMERSALTRSMVKHILHGKRPSSSSSSSSLKNHHPKMVYKRRHSKNSSFHVNNLLQKKFNQRNQNGASVLPRDSSIGNFLRKSKKSSSYSSRFMLEKIVEQEDFRLCGLNSRISDFVVQQTTVTTSSFPMDKSNHQNGILTVLRQQQL